MPELLKFLLARRGLMNDNPGAEGGGEAQPPAQAPAAAPAADDGPAPVVEPSEAMLAEEGLSRAEFAKLPPEEQKALMSDVEHEDTPWNELQRLSAEKANAPAAAPAPAAPAPAPTQPPAASPAPTPAPSPAPTPAPAPGASPAPSAPAPAPAETPAPPAPTPAPAETPAPAPAQQWHAVRSESNPLALPKVVVPPPPKPRVTKEMETQRTDAQKKLDELEAKYEEGAIQLEEYRAQRAPLRETIARVDSAVAADAAAQQVHASTYEQAFTAMVQASLRTAKELGVDYLADTAKLQELDAATTRFARAAPYMLPGKTPTDWDRWALEQAHKEVGAKYGIKFDAPPPAPAPGPAAPAPTPAPTPRPAPNLNTIPPTTRGAPPAADSSIAQGEFAHLDSLSGIELEKAVAKLTPEQQERYLDR
jgi:hypothetical protein